MGQPHRRNDVRDGALLRGQDGVDERLLHGREHGRGDGDRLEPGHVGRRDESVQRRGARAARSRSRPSSATSTRPTTPTRCPATRSAASAGDVAGLDAHGARQHDLERRDRRLAARTSSASPAATYDGAPTPKTVTQLRQHPRPGARRADQGRQLLRRRASRTTGCTNDLNSAHGRRRSVQTFAVALASPLPQIEIPVGGQHDHAGAVRQVRRRTSRHQRATQGQYPADQPDRRLLRRHADADVAAASASTSRTWSRAPTTTWTRSSIYEYTVSGSTVRRHGDVGLRRRRHHPAHGLRRSPARRHDGTYLVVRDTGHGTPAAIADYCLDTPPATSLRHRRHGSPDGAALPLYEHAHVHARAPTAAARC